MQQLFFLKALSAAVTLACGSWARNRPPFLLILFPLTLAVSPGVAIAGWVTTIDGESGASVDTALAVTADPSGDVIAAGVRQDRGPLPFPNENFQVVKFAGSTGTELWRRVIDTSQGSIDGARAVAVDGAGDVIAVGGLDDGLQSSRSVTAVIKFSGSTGTELWRHERSGNGHNTGVIVDGSGDVVLAVGSQSSDQFGVIKLSGSTGDELWDQELAGTAGSGISHAVALDPSGDVIAAGELENAGTFRDFAVIKLSGSTGTELWRQTINGTADEEIELAESVAVDGLGNIVAAGLLVNSDTTTDFAVIKFRGTDGMELWRQVIDGTFDSPINPDADEAYSVAFDGSGDVIAAGRLQNTSMNFAVIKFRGTDGGELWRHEINGTDVPGGFSGGQAEAVTVDGSGGVIAVGWLYNLCTKGGYNRTCRYGSETDFVVIKFRGGDGVELWRQEIDVLSGRDEGYAVATDESGDVIAGGSIDLPETAGGDFAVVKLDGSDGSFPPLPTPQDRDKQRCMNDLNKNLAKVAATHGKDVWRCMNDASNSRLPGQTIEECAVADNQGKVVKAKAKTISGAESKCSTPPDFGVTDPSTVNQAATDKELTLIHEIFGPDLDAVILPRDGSTKDAADCQLQVARQTLKCQETKLKEFNKCKKLGLKGKDGLGNSIFPFNEASDLELCMGEDPKGKILKACEIKLPGEIVNKCIGVDTASAFPGCNTADLGELAVCLDRMAKCQVCLALNTADGLARDSGEFCVGGGSPSGAFLDATSGVLD